MCHVVIYIDCSTAVAHLYSNLKRHRYFVKRLCCSRFLIIIFVYYSTGLLLFFLLLCVGFTWIFYTAFIANEYTQAKRTTISNTIFPVGFAIFKNWLSKSSRKGISTTAIFSNCMLFFSLSLEKPIRDVFRHVKRNQTLITN